MLSLIYPVEPRAVLGTPRSVETNVPSLCVHTRLIDEVFEWKIQYSLELVREMGATTIVEFFPWAYIERSPGNFHWEQADRIIRHAQNQGLKIIARMGFVPEWARHDESTNSTLNYLPADRYDHFADFVARFAQRYQNSVSHVIIWNEPNLSFEWGYRPVSAVEYTDLLRVVYPAVKASSPETIILAGALAPTLEPANSPHGLNDLIYLEQMYKAGAADYFDGIAVHTYGLQAPPTDEPDAGVLNYRRVELLVEIMKKFGDGHKPVYITETGWNDHPRWTHAVRPSQRAAFTVESIDFARKHWPWLNKHCLWAFRYPAPTLSYPDYFTLVTPDFQRKPIYYAIQAYARGTEDTYIPWLPPPTP